MTNEEMRVAIAEACGYRKEEPWLDGRECWGHKDCPDHVGFEEIPDYPGDLNAIQAAESQWIEAGVYQYAQAEREEMLAIEIRKLLLMRHATFRATAAQRAEAFLRAIGKWNENTNPEKT